MNPLTNVSWFFDYMHEKRWYRYDSIIKVSSDYLIDILENEDTPRGVYQGSPMYVQFQHETRHLIDRYKFYVRTCYGENYYKYTIDTFEVAPESFTEYIKFKRYLIKLKNTKEKENKERKNKESQDKKIKLLKLLDNLEE